VAWLSDSMPEDADAVLGKVSGQLKQTEEIQ
jgi:hypothetical protein